MIIVLSNLKWYHIQNIHLEYLRNIYLGKIQKSGEWILECISRLGSHIYNNFGDIRCNDMRGKRREYEKIYLVTGYNIAHNNFIVSSI